MGGSAPRILSLDDYFMVEIEKEEMDVESGKTVKNKVGLLIYYCFGSGEKGFNKAQFMIVNLIDFNKTW